MSTLRAKAGVKSEPYFCLLSWFAESLLFDNRTGGPDSCHSCPVRRSAAVEDPALLPGLISASYLSALQAERMLINMACIQRLKDFLAPVSQAHDLFLKD